MAEPERAFRLGLSDPSAGLSSKAPKGGMHSYRRLQTYLASRRRRRPPHVTDPSDYSREPRRLSSGNQLELLVDGDQTYPAMLEAIAKAKRFVHLETYILADDEVGQSFAAALEERARAGITVRVQFDSVGSVLLPAEFVQQLTEAGVEVLEFKPLRRFWFEKRWSCRDHRKLLIVDGIVAFTGGLNISCDYASFGVNSKGWRDTHVRIQGPVVSQAEALFRAMWHRAGGAAYEPYSPPSSGPESQGPHSAAIVASDGGRGTVIRQHYRHAFDRAQKTILVANAYFVPDGGLLRALTRAARRGVRVAVVVPAESDVRIVQRASERVFDRLLRHGVEIYQWPRTHMHAKTAVVDATWSVVGSYNLDAISLFQNYEVVVECISEAFGDQMNAQYEKDFEQCTRLTLSEWRRRPFGRRVSEWLAYQLKRWL